MEIRQLELFLAVAEQRNFTRAAASLHTVQSAVSAAIKALEQELGVDLFTRTSRAVDLTAEGAALVVPARKVLAAVEETRDVAASFRGEVRGSVTLGMLAARDVLEIPGALAEFRRMYPQVTVTARTNPAGGIGLLAGVLDGSLDVSLIVLPLPVQSEIDTETIFSGRFQIAASVEHPLAGRERLVPADLDGQDYVMLPRGFSARNTLEDWLTTRGVRFQLTVEVSDQGLVGNYISAGLGIGMLAEHEIAMMPGVRALDVEGFSIEFGIALATKRGKRLSAATEALIDLLRQRAENRSLLPGGLG